MNESKIAVRYAKALFLTGIEENLLESLRQDMDLFMATYSSANDFKEFLMNPVIKPSDKRKIFHEIFEKKVNTVTLSFFDLMVHNKRELYVEATARYFLQLYKKDKGIMSATITTPIPLDKQIRDTIIKQISKKFKANVELEEFVDKNIIGGFIFRIEDQQIDASILTGLQKIKRELINS
jgi:F-type H+-transporting ATPase subunit delta